MSDPDFAQRENDRKLGAFYDRQELTGRFSEYVPFSQPALVIDPNTPVIKTQAGHDAVTDALFRRAKALRRPDMLSAYLLGALCRRCAPEAQGLGADYCLPPQVLEVIERCLHDCEVHYPAYDLPEWPEARKL